MSKYQDALDHLMQSSKELKSLVEWFLIENNIEFEKITKKEVDLLVQKLKEEEPLDESKFQELLKKMK